MEAASTSAAISFTSISNASALRTTFQISNVPEQGEKKLSKSTFALLSACKETPELAAPILQPHSAHNK